MLRVRNRYSMSGAPAAIELVSRKLIVYGIFERRMITHGVYFWFDKTQTSSFSLIIIGFVPAFFLNIFAKVRLILFSSS